MAVNNEARAAIIAALEEYRDHSGGDLSSYRGAILSALDEYKSDLQELQESPAACLRMDLDEFRQTVEVVDRTMESVRGGATLDRQQLIFITNALETQGSQDAQSPVTTLDPMTLGC